MAERWAPMRAPFDPRTDLRAGPGELAHQISVDLLGPAEDWESMDDCPKFDAAETMFPSRMCGSCGLWECNGSVTESIWARRWGPYVLWLYPHGLVRSFDVAAYEAALANKTTSLPVLALTDFADRVDWPEPPGTAIPDELRLCDWIAHRVEVEPVLPPTVAVQVGAHWFARDGVHWLAYLPTLFGLPIWLGGPFIDELALQLLDDHARAAIR